MEGSEKSLQLLSGQVSDALGNNIGPTLVPAPLCQSRPNLADSLNDALAGPTFFAAGLGVFIGGR